MSPTAFAISGRTLQLPGAAAATASRPARAATSSLTGRDAVRHRRRQRPDHERPGRRQRPLDLELRHRRHPPADPRAAAPPADGRTGPRARADGRLHRAAGRHALGPRGAQPRHRRPDRLRQRPARRRPARRRPRPEAPDRVPRPLGAGRDATTGAAVPVAADGRAAPDGRAADVVAGRRHRRPGGRPGASLAAAIAWQESGFNNGMVSSASTRAASCRSCPARGTGCRATWPAAGG